MGCGSSSANKGGEYINVASAQTRTPPSPSPPTPAYVPPAPVPKASYPQPVPPAPLPPKPYRAPPAPATQPRDFNPQTSGAPTQQQQQIDSAARKEKREKRERRERSRPKEDSFNTDHQHATPSICYSAAQQKGPVVEHRKSSKISSSSHHRRTSRASPEQRKSAAYQPPPAVSELVKSTPPPAEPVQKTAPPQVIVHAPRERTPSPEPKKAPPEQKKGVVVVDAPSATKKKKRRDHNRTDYEKVHSNKGIKMSDIPQPDSKSGKPFSELYKLKGVLGTGAFSTVREGNHISNLKVSYAVKCVNRPKLTEEDEAALLDEVSILKELNHVHIIRLYDFFEEASTYYLVMERMSGGELFDRIVAKAYYNEKEARDTCKILLDAVGYCHDNSVAHRDLKPENLLLRSEEDDSAVKIADFGFAKRVLEPRSLTTQCGTPGYVAPEILEGVPYDTKSDMWSVGVILYILLGGYPPFIENNQRDLFRKIRRGEYEFHDEYWGNVSTGAKDLISSLLTVDPELRLDAHEALGNAWIRQDDESLEKKDLGVNLEEFKKFNAKRKFKAAVSTVLAVNKLQSLGKDFLKSLQD